MEFKTRGLNENEIFCCTAKKVKELFNETKIFINFAYLLKNFNTTKGFPLTIYTQKKVKGEIICSLEMTLRQENPTFSFYVLEKTIFSEELTEKFENVYLSQFYDFYCNNLKDNSLTKPQRYFMCVELFEGKLKLHETNLKY